MEKDTIRIIITFACQLRCPYCVNEQEQFRNQFNILSDATTMALIPVYNNVCITGGEPTLEWDRMLKFTRVAMRLGKKVYLYTNGITMATNEVTRDGVLSLFDGVNVGIHEDNMFVLNHLWGGHPRLRFDVNERKLPALQEAYPEARFKGWKMNDCNMPNEDWVYSTPNREIPT